MTLKPLIAVCGTTGVGKTRLGVELALSLAAGSKVINADAMQVYEGLDILTNKATLQEQRGVPHLLINFKKPGEQYVVGEWIQDATREIEQIHREGKIPIVVGGTSYWIHHLLFPNSLPSHKIASTKLSPTFSSSSDFPSSLNRLPREMLELFYSLPSIPPSAKSQPDEAFALHRLLSNLDPVMAQRWHWRDTRKVLRNLEIIKEHGRPASEVVSDAHTGTAVRYKSLIFWLYADPDTLNERLDKRVDEMLSRGLIDEVRYLCSLVKDEPDFTNGIYQSIGYREFYEIAKDSMSNQQRYNLAVEEMKRNTRKYARTQVKWIRGKTLPAIQSVNETDEPAVRAFLLDATDVAAWEDNVLKVAKTLADAFLSNMPTPDPCSLSSVARDMLRVPDRPTHPSDIIKLRTKMICPICTVDEDRPVMLESSEWDKHQQTRSHKRLARKQNGEEHARTKQASTEIPQDEASLDKDVTLSSCFIP